MKTISSGANGKVADLNTYVVDDDLVSSEVLVLAEEMVLSAAVTAKEAAPTSAVLVVLIAEEVVSSEVVLMDENEILMSPASSCIASCTLNIVVKKALISMYNPPIQFHETRTYTARSETFG